MSGCYHSRPTTTFSLTSAAQARIVVEDKSSATSFDSFLTMNLPRNYKNSKSVKIFPCLISASSSLINKDLWNGRFGLQMI
jgi:hypothetical protein